MLTSYQPAATLPAARVSEVNDTIIIQVVHIQRSCFSVSFWVSVALSPHMVHLGPIYLNRGIPAMYIMHILS